MATTNNTALIYGTIFGSTTIYIDGGGVQQQPYSGSGTPWDAQATTPIEIAMNEVQGRWTPQAAPTVPIFAGGPPFRAGRSLLYKSWDNVTETVPVTLRATNHDNAVALLLLLRRALNTATFDVPCRLVVQPKGSTLDVYYEIYYADIQEDESFINDEAGLSSGGILRAKITWTRSPFGSTSSTGTSAISSGSFGNLGTGATDNIVAYSTSLIGEQIYEGQPANINFDPVGTAAVIWLASVYSRTYSTTGSGNKTTSSTSGASATLNTPDVTVVPSNNALKARALMRLTSSTTSNVQIRVEMRITSSGTLIYAGPWISPTSGVATVVDCGAIPLDAVRRASGFANTITLALGYRSTNGSSATAGLASNDFLLYYEFCRVDATIAAASPRLDLITFPEIGDRPNLPSRPPVAATTSGGNLVDFGTIRGTVPLVRQGASLYVAWLQSGNVHDSADTASVNVKYAPLWRTFRGDD